MILRSSIALRLLASLLGVILLAGCSRGLPDFASLVEKSSPSVVNISAVPSPTASAATPHGEETPEWARRFLDDPSAGAMPDDRADARKPEPLGSGFVLWEDGYVLTNYHVVQDAGELIVRLMDRRQFPAKIVGVDPPTDLALLRIEADRLQAVRLGDSGKLRPGNWVYAIGSPFSFDYSVTAGVVSAKGRSLRSEQYVPFLQTDVAINPGNSGSPLFNLSGEVVGINSQIYSQSGSFQGVSFAIPIDVAAKVARQLRDTGKVRRGWLGVVVEDVDRTLAPSYGMDKPEGALVAEVVSGSPAEEAGLRKGDVLLSFNGVVLGASTSLPPLVGGVDPGEVANLRVIRGGKTLDFRIQIGALEDAPRPDEPWQPPAEPLIGAPAGGVLGLVVSPLTQEQRNAMRILSGGVRVDRVLGGPAAVAGIRTGDAILNVAGQEIDSPERLAEVARRLTPGSTVPVLVSRDGAPTFVSLQVPLSDASRDGR